MPKMATARRLASEASALLIADPVPVSCAGTALRTAVVSGATLIAIPNPRTVVEPRKAQYESPPTDHANSPNPKAAIVGPITRGNRAPKRSSSPPDHRDNNT